MHWLVEVGSWPAGTFEQLPSLPATAHDLQVPAHAVAQQTPCAQMLELQSAAAVQPAPFGFLPQLELTQALGETQSAVLVQSVRQAAFDPHTKGSHFAPTPGRQEPAPSQVPAAVNVEPMQLGSAHRTPAMNFRQPPAPSQVPSLPQVAAADAGH